MVQRKLIFKQVVLRYAQAKCPHLRIPPSLLSTVNQRRVIEPALPSLRRPDGLWQADASGCCKGPKRQSRRFSTLCASKPFKCTYDKALDVNLQSGATSRFENDTRHKSRMPPVSGKFEADSRKLITEMCRCSRFTQALSISQSVLHAQPLQASRIGVPYVHAADFQIRIRVPVASKPSVRG